LAAISLQGFAEGAMATSGNSRKTVAEKFEEENRLKIMAAETELHHYVTIKELARHGTNIEFISGALRELSSPGPKQKAWALICQSDMVQLLKQIAQKRDSEAFKYLLSRLLLLLGVDPPPDVFIPLRAVPGAPVKPKTLEIRAQWEIDGKPTIDDELCFAYAYVFYPQEFERARTKRSQKTLIDRVRAPLIRYREKLATQSAPSNL
jgi:hypothetical protein